MGIDVYLRWDGQSEAEEKAQYTGFSTTAGNAGYLREAYHGEPYATKVLFPECFGDSTNKVTFTSATLRARLPQAIEVAKMRSLKVYKEPLPPEVEQAFTDFVELAERKETETGKPCTVYVSY